MIYEVNPNKLCVSFAKSINDDFFPEAMAVLSGKNPGWVFVDNPETPNTAAVYSIGGEGFLMLGNEDNADFNSSLALFIDSEFKIRLASIGFNCVEISGHPRWNSHIEEVFKYKKLDFCKMFVYRLPDNFPAADKSYSNIVKVNAALLAKNYSNKKFLTDKIESFWGNMESYLKSGFGYAAVENDIICGLCFSAFIQDDICVIDIETVKEYQKRGFGEMSARQLLQECRKRNLKPHWDCMEHNKASRKTAEKIGLEYKWEYKCYDFYF